ncbi:MULTISPECIES: nitroreductase family deazaflavin-dependent oxidoreductase [Actinoplanes]|uniref:nitroreductase family deazaflavin-dependent oxidoreductase n=1 Tax=Actinoplanes TaxID=1865 RepID=UPI0005F2D077|nr:MULTISPECIES: nitroreductase family deazaflavin-dependent oxidoreductase [Actinoplanes]GLY03117.1 nitroreductase [Actinoplanes sp. NBRC 101535]
MTSAIDLHGPAHVQRYLETGGEDGYHWRNGTEILILFTTGRQSGEERSHALIFREFNGAYLVVASKGGAPQPPAWFVNLRDNPEVEVQIKAERFPATARVATAAEKPAMWAAMTEVWPDYDEYQTKTDREIPVVVLERR